MRGAALPRRAGLLWCLSHKSELPWPRGTKTPLSERLGLFTLERLTPGAVSRAPTLWPETPLPTSSRGGGGPEPGSLALFVSGAEGSILGEGDTASFPVGAPSLAWPALRGTRVCCPVAFGCLEIWAGDFANPPQREPELTQLPLTRDLSLQDFLGAWHLFRSPHCPLPPIMRQRLGRICK